MKKLLSIIICTIEWGVFFTAPTCIFFASLFVIDYIFKGFGYGIFTVIIFIIFLYGCSILYLVLCILLRSRKDIAIPIGFVVVSIYLYVKESNSSGMFQYLITLIITVIYVIPFAVTSLILVYKSDHTRKDTIEEVKKLANKTKAKKQNNGEGQE